MLSFLRRVLRIEPGVTLGQWAYDRIANNWQAIVGLFGGVGGMSYLAAITDWLKPWGPVGWGATGIVFGLLIWLVIAMISLLKSYREAQQARALLDSTMSKDSDKVNILERQFVSKIIRPNDMFLVYNPVLQAKTFIECHIVGPGVLVFLDRCELLSSSFNACNYIVINPGPMVIHGSVGFASSRFERCNFFNITFLLMPEIAKNMLDQSNGTITLLGYESTITRPPDSPSAVRSPSSPPERTSRQTSLG